MNEIETFFFTWRYTAGAFFSSVAFVLTIGRISSLLISAHVKSVSDAVEQALINQRQDNHADVIGEFILIIKDQAADNKRYCAVVNKSANINAKVLQLLERNNITIKD